MLGRGWQTGDRLLLGISKQCDLLSLSKGILHYEPVKMGVYTCFASSRNGHFLLLFTFMNMKYHILPYVLHFLIELEYLLCAYFKLN